MKICQQCQISFEIGSNEQIFYDKLKLTAPKLCPECRAQRRMSWRNEKTLYKRECGLCLKEIVSIYSKEKSFPVYCQPCFWSDGWNPLDYGMEFDFSRPFFEQFEALMQKVPRLAIVNKQSENSDYCNYSFANKNCYLTFGNHYEEDSLYGRYSTKNKNCLDYLLAYNSSLCYEGIFLKNCYKSVYLENCESTDESYFSRDLVGCKNCLFSSGLRHKQYYIFNQPYSKEEYSKKLKEYQLNTHNGFKAAEQLFEDKVKQTFPIKAISQMDSENCIGDNLSHCKNAINCFDCDSCEDIAYAAQADQVQDGMDMTCMGYDKSEICYETIGCSGLFNGLFCDSCWHSSDLLYSNLCFSSKNCLGSISLQQKDHCILNKQYSKEEYDSLLPKIIEYMKQTGEWGEFFPVYASPFAYNETIAQEYYSLSQEEILAKEWKWKLPEDKLSGKVTKSIPATLLPEAIEEIPDDVLNWAIECEETGRPFKIQKSELMFYRQMDLPLPHFHPDVRFEKRMKRRQPRHLWNRNCYHCEKEIVTTYSPERPEKIYCEECHLKEIY